MKLRLRYCVLLAALLSLISCASAKIYYPSHTPHNARAPAHRLRAQTYWENVKRLERQLAALNKNVDRFEARLVAETAIRDSAVLAEQYQLIRPAIIHNVFVKLGLKNRGLCWQWTEDLLKRLEALNLKTFKLHWAVAYRGSDLREHNCVVITAKGLDFYNGIVLDPWRNSGDLFWALVTKDRYPWQQLPPSDW